MNLTHICPICGKNYLRNILHGTPNPDMICPHCELENITNPPLRYYIAGEEVTLEEYNRFINGE